MVAAGGVDGEVADELAVDEDGGVSVIDDHCCWATSVFDAEGDAHFVDTQDAVRADCQVSWLGVLWPFRMFERSRCWC